MRGSGGGYPSVDPTSLDGAALKAALKNGRAVVDAQGPAASLGRLTQLKNTKLATARLSTPRGFRLEMSATAGAPPTPSELINAPFSVIAKLNTSSEDAFLDGVRSAFAPVVEDLASVRWRGCVLCMGWDGRDCVHATSLHVFSAPPARARV